MASLKVILSDEGARTYLKDKAGAEHALVVDSSTPDSSALDFQTFKLSNFQTSHVV